MKVTPWFKCECGKLHIATHITHTTKCKCGKDLYPQVPIRSTNARGKLK